MGWLYLINVNPIFASCYSHPLHPIARKERFLVYALAFLFVTNVSADTALASTCQTCQFRGCDIPMNYSALLRQLNLNTSAPPSWLPEFNKFLPGFCCRSNDYGAYWFLETFHGLGGPLYSFVANLVFMLMCFQLMMCACVQQRSKRDRRIGEFIGYALFVIIAIIIICHFAYTGIKAIETGTWLKAIWYVVSSKCMSWIGVSIFNTCVFTVLFHIQRPKPEGHKWKCMDPPTEYGAPDTRSCIWKALNPRFHILCIEYQEWMISCNSQHEGISLNVIS